MAARRTDRIIQVFLGLLMGGFLFTIYGTFQERIVEAGDKAPNFSIQALDGRTYTASDFGGKVLVLNFWATWCPPCVAEMPSLNRFAQENKASGIVVLAVSVDRNENAFRTFVGRQGLTFPTARDPEANISTEYGTFKWPETYVIDRSGKVRMKLIADQNWTDPKLVEAIKAFL